MVEDADAPPAAVLAVVPAQHLGVVRPPPSHVILVSCSHQLDELSKTREYLNIRFVLMLPVYAPSAQIKSQCCEQRY